MSNYNFNSTVSSQEAQALKEMIFKRARERAQAYTEEVQSSYTESVQNDIMDLARDSFVSGKNPFSVQRVQEPEAEEHEEKQQEIGFAKRNINEIKAQINYRNKSADKDIAEKAVDSAMADAHADFVKKQSFMGALEFLNSQATITLVKHSGKTFEALA